MSTKKKTLLEKYDIPISCLDFAYVDKCTNPREMEKIVNILRSGEEGYYPELTKKAEEKLAELKPNSKLFRTEEPLLTQSHLTSSEWKAENAPIVDWSSNVKNVDKLLQKIDSESMENNNFVKRATRKIQLVAGKMNESSHSLKPTSRIKSTDYSAWDKFDADTEILKMDLQEERKKEEIERMNEKNSSAKEMASVKNDMNLDNLTMIEREKLAICYKDKGNDYFRAKEYENSIREYTTSINIYPNAASFNNRAISHIKLNNFEQGLLDCKECLRREPNNVKALFRKADCLLNLNRSLDAMDTYFDIMEIEPSNVHAVKAYNDLSLRNPTNRKATGSRIQISEESEESKNNINKDSKNNKIGKQVEDYADLIKPSRIIKNKFVTAMENISKEPSKSIGQRPTKEENSFSLNPEFNSRGKVLIEEI